MDKKKRFKAFSDFPMVIGTVLESYNSLEESFNQIILSYFNPKSNIEDFKNILLNSSVLDLGAKCKLFSNMTDFDQKIVEKIRRIGSIRNGIAHNNAMVSINVEPQKNNRVENVETKNIVQIMNSSGRILNLSLIHI